MAIQVLIVDDDKMIRALLSDYLCALGHDVRLASNGVECLKEIATQVPDIFLIDLQMPEMNGLELIAELRSKSSTCKVPIVMLSANMADLIPPDSPCADRYLEKPFALDQLRELIGGLFEDR